MVVNGDIAVIITRLTVESQENLLAELVRMDKAKKEVKKASQTSRLAA
ncbi:hypothetical protein ACFLU1_02805 [Chloroflexota bacterium]